MKYLFGIITNGERPVKLLHEIDSIRALGLEDYEIIVAGNPGDILPEGVGLIHMPDEADAGKLGAMRNALCRASDADIYVITDDDMIFQPDFKAGMEQYGDDWLAMCTRLLNPDGTRNWDWVTKGGPRGHTLIEYWETDPFLYCTGGRIILKPAAFERVQWDAERGFNQEEDVDFSRRLQAAGIPIRMNKHVTLVHDDPSYTSAVHTVYKVR